MSEIPKRLTEIKEYTDREVNDRLLYEAEIQNETLGRIYSNVQFFFYMCILGFAFGLLAYLVSTGMRF